MTCMQLTTLMPLLKAGLGGYFVLLITVCSSYLNNFWRKTRTNCLRTMTINYIYVAGYLICWGWQLQTLEPPWYQEEVLVQLLIPARQCNCPLPAGITIFKKPVVVRFSHDTQRIYSGYPLGIMGIFFNEKMHEIFSKFEIIGQKFGI